MARTGFKLGLGLTRVNAPTYSSERGYVSQMNGVIKGLEKDLLSILDAFEVETPEIVRDALQPVFAESQRIVPTRSGRLKRSGYLEITNRGKRPHVEIGYGRGGNPRYAVLVHELPQKHAPPTQSKFLERPILQDMQGIINRIANGYRERILS